MVITTRMRKGIGGYGGGSQGRLRKKASEDTWWKRGNAGRGLLFVQGLVQIFLKVQIN